MPRLRGLELVGDPAHVVTEALVGGEAQVLDALEHQAVDVRVTFPAQEQLLTFVAHVTTRRILDHFVQVVRWFLDFGGVPRACVPDVRVASLGRIGVAPARRCGIAELVTRWVGATDGCHEEQREWDSQGTHHVASLRER